MHLHVNQKSDYDDMIKALSMHIQKPYKGNNCLSSHSCHFVKIIFCEPNSFMHMFNVSALYRQRIKLFNQKL